MQAVLKLDNVNTARQADDPAPYSDPRRETTRVSDPDVAIKHKFKDARASDLLSFEAQLQNQIVNEYKQNNDLPFAVQTEPAIESVLV